MTKHIICYLFGVSMIFGCNTVGVIEKAEKVYEETIVFPLQYEHVHGPTIVELPNGDLLAAWFQGSGERWADDVRIMGARIKQSNIPLSL